MPAIKTAILTIAALAAFSHAHSLRPKAYTDVEIESIALIRIIRDTFDLLAQTLASHNAAAGIPQPDDILKCLQQDPELWLKTTKTILSKAQELNPALISQFSDFLITTWSNFPQAITDCVEASEDLENIFALYSISDRTPAQVRRAFEKNFAFNYFKIKQSIGEVRANLDQGKSGTAGIASALLLSILLN
eukprot:TRINITY_DN8400_c0_g1_i1.p1 TRINITY_DN8400_c0_g1~~TRINITY_DN8400_c0_g1_i1.p1  ORF type:complete len:191 (-),score=24.77 TRINITY_DN8400_c0_g1_i1:198-770(-)